MTRAKPLDDVALARLRRIGGQRLVTEMIALFLANAPQRVEAAVQGGRAGDLRAVERAAHSLKSTAANVGARGLQRICERLEADAAAERAEAVAPALEELVRAFSAVRPVLEAAAARGERR